MIVLVNGLVNVRALLHEILNRWHMALTGRDVEIYSADAPGADPLKVTAAPLVATPTPRGGGATTDDDEDDEPLPPSYGRAPAPVTALPLPVVRLSYHGGNHYNSVVPLDEDAAETESQGSAE